MTNAEVDGRPVLRAGMFARVQFGVGKEIDAVLVPKDAIVLGGRSPTVFVVDPKTSTVAPVPVELGLAVDGMLQVKGAIAPGAVVVVRGNERLRPGMKVRATPAAPAAGDDR